MPLGKADLSLGNQFIQLILQPGQTQNPFTISNAIGSTLFKIDTNGNVNITGNLTAAVNALFVNAANGGVGIGTVSPANYKLSVIGDINASSGNFSNINIAPGGTITAGTNTLNLGAGGTTEPQTLQVYYRTWRGPDDLRLYTGSTPGAFSIYTKDAGGTDTQRLQITGNAATANVVISNSNVGIGTGNLTANNVTAKNIGGVIYADQYATLNLALAAGNSIYVPDGTYTVTSSLVLTGNQTIKCSSNAHIIGSGNIDVFSGQIFGNVTIDGCDITGGGQNGISFVHVNDTVISNNKIHGASIKGIVISGNSNRDKIMGNIISNNGQEGNTVSTDLATNTTPQNIIISNNLYVSNGAYGGFGSVTQNSPASQSYIIWSNNIVEGNNVSENGAKLIGCNYCILNNNIIKNVTKNGIELGSQTYAPFQYANRIVVSGNTISNWGSLSYSSYCGIRLQASSNASIYGNVLIAGGPSSTGICENGNGYNWVHDNDGTVTIAQTTSTAYNNRGSSPFNFGNLASTPTAFGAGDSFYNTSSNKMAYYNGTNWIQYP